MEMEGRGFSDFLKSSAEDILVKSIMDSPIGNPMPNMEMLGFKHLLQPFGADGEELLNSWLMNGEISTSAITHRTFQPSMRSLAENEIHASNVFLPKTWLPLTSTKSISSELRSYDSIQEDYHVSSVLLPPHDISVHGTHSFKQEKMNTSSFCNIPMVEMPRELQTFKAPPTFSSSFCSRMATTNTVSSVMSMHNGTLECKELEYKVQKESLEGNFFDKLIARESESNKSPIQGADNQATDFHMFSPVQVQKASSIPIIEKPLIYNMKGFSSEANHMHTSAISLEHSQSESSTAAPALSAGLKICDGTVHLRPAFSICGNFGKHVGSSSPEPESKANDVWDKSLVNNFKDSRKKSLARVDSVSSVDTVDSTKKRRVERSLKMAEAKGRNSTLPVSSDVQGILKRCANLEKEVRSLKLNLSFMNRKDSEQTKQIEGLQKQNEELFGEKERLLDEMERIIFESAKI